MNFTLFGIEVEIELSFWVSSILLGWSLASSIGGRAGFMMLVLWTLIVFVSVLVHEMGHALAIRRHRIQPEITLHFMGGRTTWRALLPLRRIDHVIISAAGPFAGFALAGLVYGIEYLLLRNNVQLPTLAHLAILQLKFVNLWWGIFNLIPVLPLDGGHVLEHALGPKRMKITATISMLVGFGAAIFFLKGGSVWAAYIMGMGAFQSLRMLQSGGTNIDESDLRPRTPVVEAEPMISAEILSILHRARDAVASDDLAKARSLCTDLLARDPKAEGAPPPNARREAFEILAWVALSEDKLDDASAKLEEAKALGEVDPALVGAVLFAKRDMKEARRVLENARARGDDRKEVVGPLIQILIEQKEVARAAAIAYDIADSLSEDDARQMARLSFENDAFDWSARLYETAFDRAKLAEDAYEAARAHALDGAYDRASEMLKKAVAAGFNDRTRVWSDKAFEALRAREGLDELVPRP